MAEEIVAAGGLEGPELDRSDGFQPLSTMPKDAPERWRHHWERLAHRASTQYRAAVVLKCCECCAWDRAEVKACAIRGCPLWALNRRIFGQGEEV